MMIIYVSKKSIIPRVRAAATLSLSLLSPRKAKKALLKMKKMRSACVFRENFAYSEKKRSIK